MTYFTNQMKNVKYIYQLKRVIALILVVVIFASDFFMQKTPESARPRMIPKLFM